jgi:ribose 5-phosphate isomerase B
LNKKTPAAMNSFSVHRLAIGGDHAGFSMKAMLAAILGEQGFQLVDCGPANDDPCDFPDAAERVGTEILRGRAERGILVCGSGVGVSVAANKLPGIRASLCHDSYSARQGVEHDDMNVLCIGARVIGPELAKEIVRSFLQAQYTPQPRHQMRVEKITALEQRALRGEFSSRQ